MIELIGSNYRYAGQRLSQPEIIVVRDHHFDEESQCFHIEPLLTHSECDPLSHTVIFDHVLQHDDTLSQYNLVCFPSFMARENTEFVQQQIHSDWQSRSCIFNFMINKPRPHRIRLLELVQQHRLSNYSHSLAWRTNTVNNIAVTDYRFGPEVVMDRGVKNGSFRNARTYQDLLQKTVFEPSCISLITEPVYYERETIITEKTLMAMWAGTLPIWVGGWRIADWMASHGFDVFADVIDHSYQDLADPAQRASQAIERNLDLLQDFDRARDLVRTHQARMAHNLQLLQNNFFTQLCRQTLQQHTGQTQQVLHNLLGR